MTWNEPEESGNDAEVIWNDVEGTWTEHEGTWNEGVDNAGLHLGEADVDQAREGEKC